MTTTYDADATARVYDSIARYGVRCEGDQSVPDHEAIHARPSYTLAELKAAGGRVCRVRIFKDCGRYDLSTAHGMVNGDMVRIAQLPHIFCPKFQFKAQLIAWAKEEGVYAVGIGLLDEGNWSILG